MNIVLIALFSVFSNTNQLFNNWLLSDASIFSCPGGSGQFLLDGFDRNCYDTDSGRICHELYMSFETDGSYSMRVETRSVESGERYTSYSYDGRYTVGADGALTTCDPDMRSCEEMSYTIDRDKLILSDFLGCTGTMTFVLSE